MKLVGLVFAVCGALLAEAPVPRPAPELQIGTERLSSWRGEPALLAFISTECPHCQRVSGVIEQLSHEFPGRLRVAALAFNERADVEAFRKKFALTYPVWTASGETVRDFLGVPRGARLGTPQMVVIDRSGVIRAQSERLGTPLLQTPEYLRGLLQAMFAEPAR